ncbi:vWA domain-containing protein [Succinimonas sp.]|uniref:vWA domain-containing protein n=1 Tax=Succinimonas sp. TaxID=1936151 RepID=UPI0038707642
MAFDPTKFKAPKAKKLPVILLLDVSGSMADNHKIETLYDSVTTMLRTFVEAHVKEKTIDVAIITFGDEVLLHTPYTPARDLQKAGVNQFRAYGCTPMGTALKMAKEMIDDKETTPTGNYRPAVVLVSDGQPNDSWEQPLDDFIREGRSAKCQRFAVAIGADADRNILRKFCGSDETLFYAERSADLIDAFKQISMSVSIRLASPDSKQEPTPSGAGFDNNKNQDDNDDYAFL